MDESWDEFTNRLRNALDNGIKRGGHFETQEMRDMMSQGKTFSGDTLPDIGRRVKCYDERGAYVGDMTVRDHYHFNVETRHESEVNIVFWEYIN